LKGKVRKKKCLDCGKIIIGQSGHSWKCNNADLKTSDRSLLGIANKLKTMGTGKSIISGIMALIFLALFVWCCSYLQPSNEEVEDAFEEAIRKDAESKASKNK
jgi:uncharacterized membrane protein YvbJ